MKQDKAMSTRIAPNDDRNRSARRAERPAGDRAAAMEPETRRRQPSLRPMAFQSILGGVPEQVTEAPDCFADLNLDQVIAAVTAGRDQYDLKPFFHAPLHDVDAVRYRHEVFRDLENETLFRSIAHFARQMREMRELIAKAAKLHYRYQKERLFLDAVSTYCDTITGLARDLAAADLHSRGFRALRDFVAEYTGSALFAALQEQTKRLRDNLAAIQYCLHIKGSRIRVRKPELEIDSSAEVERTFEKFKRGAVKSYLVEFPEFLEMNHVEAAVLELVAKLYPEVFGALDDYFVRNRNYVDPKVAGFDREIQFYICYLEYIAPLRQTGLSFCYPDVSSADKVVSSVEGFDLALARKLLAEQASVVPNDFRLDDPERIFVVTGPNQGGKTTFARAFGQLHYLASIGCPVPGKQARLFLFDQLFTHFEREEDIQTLRGKLEDDLVRIHDVLGLATPNSIVIMNEIFTSTTLHDALFLGRNVLEKISKLDLLAVCVTFIDELSALNEKTVSLVSTVDPQNPALRTFKILRKPADGLSHAMAIVRKHRLAHADLKARLAS